MINHTVSEMDDMLTTARRFFLLAPAILALAFLSAGACAQPASHALSKQSKPVLGWSSWSYIRMDPTAKAIEAQARALVSSGLAKAGYQYVNVDDFWYVCNKPAEGAAATGPDVDGYGRWVTDTSRFPSRDGVNGMEAVARYVHGLGLKFGIYITPGISRQAVAKNTPIQGTKYTADDIADPSVSELNYNCKGMVGIDFSKPGAQQYIDSLARMFAGWGVDFIKLDGIASSDVDEIEAWSKAIEHSGRPMVLDVTQGSFTSTIAPVLQKYAGQWVVTPDIECYSCNEKSGTSFPLTNWDNLVQRFHYASVWQQYAVSGGYNDLDSIEIGNGNDTGLTPTERKTQLSLWALEAAPLILGTDLTRLDAGDVALLANPAVIAVDQDGIAAARIIDPNDRHPDWHHLVFAKTEPDGSVVVGLFNTGESAAKMSIDASLIGLPGSKSGYSLDNLWTHATTRVRDAIGATVPAHGVVLYRARATGGH